MAHVGKEHALRAAGVLGALTRLAQLNRARRDQVFETVIPSKIFESMALERPIVLGVRGESRRIVVDECGAGIAFPPEDVDGLLDALQTLRADPELCLRLGEQGRANKGSK